MKTHKVPDSKTGIRIDVYMLGIIPNFTRSKVQSLIKKEHILINGKPTKPSYILRGMESIDYTVVTPVSKTNNIEFEQIPIDIIFEDESIIAVNKTPGLVVHPGAGNYSGTLLNGVINKIDEGLFESTPGIVHRLDKETSGVIIIAKDPKSHSFISKQFEKRKVTKEYRALVWGNINDHGIIEGNIIRNSRDRKTFILTNADGRYSKTEYELIKNMGPISYIKLFPSTGRTHQIRVHMKSIGHPILSDASYSGGKSQIKSFHVKYTTVLRRVFKVLDRVALHAKSINFIHPRNKKKIELSVPMPNDMLKVIRLLESNEHI